VSALRKLPLPPIGFATRQQIPVEGSSAVDGVACAHVWATASVVVASFTVLSSLSLMKGILCRGQRAAAHTALKHYTFRSLGIHERGRGTFVYFGFQMAAPLYIGSPSAFPETRGGKYGPRIDPVTA